jgi:hypothetical protein
MTHGFHGREELLCEGIVGDGCGGGRLFFVEEEKLFAYDPLTKERIELLAGIKDAKSIMKKGCHITIVTARDSIVFDLSLLQRVES